MNCPCFITYPLHDICQNANPAFWDTDNVSGVNSSVSYGDVH